MRWAARSALPGLLAKAATLHAPRARRIEACSRRAATLWALLAAASACTSANEPPRPGERAHEAASVERPSARDAGPRGAASDAAPTATQLADAGARTLPAQRAPRLTLRSVTGEVRANGVPLAAASELAGDSELVLARGAELRFALDDFAELALTGPATARVAPDAEPALLLREGLLRVDCAPRAARSTTSALWLATESARLDVVQSARFVLRARAGRAGELSVVSGYVDVRERGDQALTLARGARCLGADARPRNGVFSELAQAEQALATRALCAPTRLVSVAEPLRAALSELERSEAHERTLLAEHRQRAAAGDPRASEPPRELAVLASELLTQRARARALQASFEAERLAASLDAEQRALIERARRLAPYRE